MEAGIEFLPVGGRSRRNRKWPDEVKARIVAETLMPGVTVNDVARRYGVPANHVSSWRTLARTGRLVLPAPEDPVEFTALMVGPLAEAAEAADAARSKVADLNRPEIVTGAVVIRLESGASAERIASVVCALAANS